MLQPMPCCRRPAAILPFVVITLVVLIAFIALAVDLGMVAVARTQCQNAADAAAMAGTRALDGNAATQNNSTNAKAIAVATATGNKVLGTNIRSDQVVTDIGSYTYDDAATPPKFIGRIPNTNNEPYTLMRVKVENVSSPTAFARIFGVPDFETSAVATAVHRPRDIAVVVDFSGSMRFSSLMGAPYSGIRDGGSGGRSSGSNNPESVYPEFGHYSSTSAGMRWTTDRTINSLSYEPANVTASDPANDNRPTVVADFFQNAAFATTKVPAFANANGGSIFPQLPPDSYATTPGGDNYLRRSNTAGQPYAINIGDVLTGDPTQSPAKDDAFETNGYPHFTGVAFNGYTMGPRYWGKTFFIWPPDPRSTWDWRKKFFFKSDTLTGVDDNELLWDDSDNWRVPRSGSTVYYYINYRAIVDWLKNTGANPFPSVVRAGNIVYYTALPDQADSTLNTRFWARTYNDNSERIWKEYIDYVIGVRQTGSTSWTTVPQERSGYGYDFDYGTVRITAKPTATPTKYMSYRDNPYRPRTRLWFGAMTFMDFIGHYNEGRYWWPGTCHEAPLYACKIGIRAALDNIKASHPNDFLALIYFSVPREASDDTGGRFNTARSPLSKNYLYATNSLFFPQKTLKADGTSNGTEVTPYDADNIEVPRAYGGTCYSMGLMLAYNQLASAPPGDTTLRRYITPTTNIPEGVVGGMGRKGAQKILIFETDGEPNTTASPNPADPQTSGTFKYYKVRYNPSNTAGSEYPSVDGSAAIGTVETQIYAVVDKLTAEYTQPRKPFRLHCIGFGPFVESSNPNSATAKARLRTMQEHGNVNDGLPSYKVITGNDTTVATNLTNAISTIVQGGVQVTLIE